MAACTARGSDIMRRNSGFCSIAARVNVMAGGHNGTKRVGIAGKLRIAGHDALQELGVRHHLPELQVLCAHDIKLRAHNALALRRAEQLLQAHCGNWKHSGAEQITYSARLAAGHAVQAARRWGLRR